MDEPLTIPRVFAETVSRSDDAPALGSIRGGRLSWQTWAELADEVRSQAAAIAAAGIQPGDRVAQVSENRREWIVTDLAIHLARGVHVPIHATLPPPLVAEQIRDSGARLAFVSNRQLLGESPNCDLEGVRIVEYDEAHSTLAEFVAGASAAAIARAAVDQSRPDDLATILYTSGTTGRPRGVMLSQHNLAGNAAATADTIGSNPADVLLNFLPLSHIFARTCDLYCWLCTGSRLVIAEGRETVLRDCQLAGPHHINAVPYFYQKVYDRLRDAEGDSPAAVRQALGGNVRTCCCGGAALAPEVEAWFDACGLPVMSGYGLTETSPVVSMSTVHARRSGSVGRPLAGVEVRIADDGEVLVRGPNVMLGYWNEPQATAEAIRDGWLQTGDLGSLDADGFLTIRGRKKEMIVLSTGKNVAPTRVEGLLAASPLVEQVAVVGDGRSHLAAIIVPSADALKAEMRRRRIFAWSARHALRHRKVRAMYAEEIARRLRDAAREEQVHAFTLIGRGFSIEQGEFTPKLSLCREVIQRNFAAEIEALFAEQEPKH